MSKLGMDSKTMPAIIVATTFRDFKGTENDIIQYTFLESLKKQTYRNFELCVTVFREKEVEKSVSAIGMPCRFIHSDPGEFRYSLTTVFENGVARLTETGADLMLWTTCDIEFEPDYFEKIVSVHHRFDVFTSHPHYCNSKISKTDTGFDFLVISKRLLLLPAYMEAVAKYRYYEWGIFEHFLIALCTENSARMVNLLGFRDVFKSENDRVITDESKSFFDRSWKRNASVFSKYLYEHRVASDFFDLEYCHAQFHPARLIPYYISMHKAKPYKPIRKFVRRIKSLMAIIYKGRRG